MHVRQRQEVQEVLRISSLNAVQISKLVRLNKARQYGERLIAAIIRSSLVAFALVALPFSANALDRTISVSGQCLRTTLPDRGSINIVPEFLNADIKVASKQATDSYEKIKKAVQALKLANLELQTSEYSVQQMNDYVKGKSVSRGFRARMGLLVITSDVARLGEVIAIAGTNNVKDVGALNTYLSEEKSRSEREACLEEAIEHAGAKASRMAKAAGARLGKIVTLSEQDGGYSPPPPVPMMARMNFSAKMQDDAPAPTVDTQTQKISLAVSAVYSLE